MTTALVVDDSPFVQTVLYKVLSEHGYGVLTADDGTRAVEVLVRHEPELVVIDADTPDADGVAVIESMVGHHPMRVLALSASAELRERLEALSHDAIACLHRDGNDLSIDLGELEQQLEAEIQALEAIDIEAGPTAQSGSSAEVATAGGGSAPVSSDSNSPAGPAPSGAPGPGPSTVDITSDVVEFTTSVAEQVSDEIDRPTDQPTGTGGFDRAEGWPDSPVQFDGDSLEGATVVIGASTGGPRVVESILACLPVALDAKILVVQHMPATFTDRFARRLDKRTDYDVREATDDDCVTPGSVLVARGDTHLAVERATAESIDVSLVDTPPRHGVRPSIDVTMESLAAHDVPPLLGVVLTGMGRDGVAGLGDVQAAGGTTIAQDETTSPVFGIPRRAIDAGAVDTVLPAAQIPRAIVESFTTTGDRNA